MGKQRSRRVRGCRSPRPDVPALPGYGTSSWDVRTAEERKFVGLVPGSVHVTWATGTSLTRNPRFTRDL